MTQNVQFSQGVLPPKPNLLNESLKWGDSDFITLALQKNYLPDDRTLTHAFMSQSVSLIEYARHTLKTVPDDKTLTTAVASNKVALVQLAISYKAFATEETDRVAKKINNPEILDLLRTALRSTSAPFPPVKMEPAGGPDNGVTRASRIGNSQAVQRALQTQPVQRQTLLAAAESGDRDIVHQVIQKGAVPHRVPGKKSELSAACQAKDPYMVEELIVQGVEPDKTTLSLAYSSKKIRIVDAVLKAGARGDEDPNCLTIAVQNFPDDKEAIRTAVKAGAKPYNNVDQFHTLNCSIEAHCTEEVCKILLDAGAKPANTNNEYNTLNRALEKNRVLWKVLLERGAKPANDPTGTYNTFDRVVTMNEVDQFIKAGARASHKTLSLVKSRSCIEAAIKAGGVRLDPSDTRVFHDLIRECPKLTPQFVAAGGKPDPTSIECLVRASYRNWFDDWFYESLESLCNAGATCTDNYYRNAHFGINPNHLSNYTKDYKTKYERYKALLKKVKKN